MAKQTKLRKASKSLINDLKPYWTEAKKIEDKYWYEMNRLEGLAKARLKIDVELFHCDGSLVGIGDYPRTMELITADELEKK